MTEDSRDVMVVGSGAAGMMAALRSIIGGARVTMLEVSDLFGGTSAISGAACGFPGQDRPGKRALRTRART